MTKEFLLKPSELIEPKAIHSHNDYWRERPVYDAINNGCLSIEADVWLIDGQLIVSHDGVQKSKFSELYVDRLIYVLEHFAPGARGPSEDQKFRGIYTRNTGLSLQFVIDVKTEPEETWAVVMKELQPLMDRNLLSYFERSKQIPAEPLDSKRNAAQPYPSGQYMPNPWLCSDDTLKACGITRSVITVVATGNYLPELVNNINERYYFVDMGPNYFKNKSVFYRGYDEKEKILSTGPMFSYNYASGFKVPVGVKHILATRAWNTREWPIHERQRLWGDLLHENHAWINADDLDAAATF